MPESRTDLSFTPVHPLDFQHKRMIEEREHLSSRWPEVTRVVSVYENAQAQLAVMVCFRPSAFSGNIDRVRCYNAVAGPVESVNHLTLVGDFVELAEQVETKFEKKLSMFFGKPGETAPASFNAV